MIGVARVGDTGEGVCRVGHANVSKGSNKDMTTEFITGSPDVFTNGIPTTIVGTIGITDCDHYTEAITGSDTVFVNNVPIHRLTDTGIVTDDGGGDYETVTASTDVFSG